MYPFLFVFILLFLLTFLTVKKEGKEGCRKTQINLF